MTPPPTTHILFGIFVRERAPVEETTNYSSVPRPLDAGNALGSDPVAMMQFLNLI
jgi:hypothetical protein